ncbi:MAG: hypothetical protein ACLUSP_02620 [Christensenellales bacterium]
MKNAGIVSVHDGARPFVTREVVDRSSRMCDKLRKRRCRD